MAELKSICKAEAWPLNYWFMNLKQNTYLKSSILEVAKHQNVPKQFKHTFVIDFTKKKKKVEKDDKCNGDLSYGPFLKNRRKKTRISALKPFTRNGKKDGLSLQ